MYPNVELNQTLGRIFLNNKYRINKHLAAPNLELIPTTWNQTFCLLAFNFLTKRATLYTFEQFSIKAFSLEEFLIAGVNSKYQHLLHCNLAWLSTYCKFRQLLCIRATTLLATGLFWGSETIHRWLYQIVVHLFRRDDGGSWQVSLNSL